MKPHHITLLTCYLTFLVGMVTGTALAHNPVLWIAVIILSALAIALMGVPLIKPRKKSIPRRASRVSDIVSLAKGWLGFASVSSSVPNYEREHP